MQFSLLNFLIGLPEMNALASGAGSAEGGQGQGADASLFSELLVDVNAAGGDLQQGQQQTGGELVHELVANVTVAQEVDAELTDTVDIAAIKELLGHKITPEEAKSLLAQMDADAQQGEAHPEGLKEILESIEAGGEDVSVQDMLAQLPAPQDNDAIQEPRQNTVQRMLQWLQQTLNPNAAPLEALAYANAASMFPDVKAAQISAPRRGEGEDSAEEKDVLVMIPMAQSIVATEEALPEVELPAVQYSTAAPVDEAPVVEDALVLVATKHNAAPVGAGVEKSNAFDAFIADMSAAQTDVAEIDTSASTAVQDTEAPIGSVGQTNHQQANEARTTETVRIHHAHLAYQRSEVMEQVQVGVRQAVRDGVDRITIQLNPQDLGRVEVKMDIVADGMSHVSFLVEKQETFDLLQRDARTLERMLQEAGVRADAGSMEFNLRQDSQSKESWGEATNDNNNQTTGEDDSTTTLSTRELPTSTYLHLISDRIDIRA